MTSKVLYNTQYLWRHGTLQAFEHVGALYMHIVVNKHLMHTGFKPSTSQISNEPQGRMFTAAQRQR